VHPPNNSVELECNILVKGSVIRLSNVIDPILTLRGALEFDESTIRISYFSRR
jgi:hypothetical protein